MDLTVEIGVAELVIGVASLVVAYLAWRYPRPAPSGKPVEGSQGDEEGLGLAIGTLLVLAARSRRKTAKLGVESRGRQANQLRKPGETG